MNTSNTSIVSPRSKVSPTVGELIVSSVTPGGPRLPFTLCATAFAIAFVPRPKLAAIVLSRASLIAPLFSVKALAPMLIPVESASAAATV